MIHSRSLFEHLQCLSANELFYILDHDWKKENTEVKLMGLDGIDMGEDGPVIVNNVNPRISHCQYLKNVFNHSNLRISLF